MTVKVKKLALILGIGAGHSTLAADEADELRAVDPAGTVTIH